MVTNKPGEMKKRFLNIGWKAKVAQKRSTFSISINKAVVVGAGLFKGQELYCYLAEEKGRPIAIVYLDGKNQKLK